MSINWEKVDALAGGLTKSELYNESLFALGGAYVYDNLKIPAPTAGSLVLLEIIGSPFLDGSEITDNDIDICLFILVMGKDTLGAVFEDRLCEIPLITRVKDFVQIIPKYNRVIIKVFLDTYFKYNMNGFDMIPGTDGKPKKMTFDTEWLASYSSICKEITGYDMDKIIWDMPILMGGFCFARYGKENGQKNIERWEDHEAQIQEMKRQMKNG